MIHKWLKNGNFIFLRKQRTFWFVQYPLFVTNLTINLDYNCLLIYTTPIISPYLSLSLYWTLVFLKKVMTKYIKFAVCAEDR